MSSSREGSGSGSLFDRMKRSFAGPLERPGKTGFHWEYGARVDSSATWRGPLRRSYKAAMVCRQLAAAIERSAVLNSTWASLSASANVVVETCGPTPGPVPKAGGIPAGGADGSCVGACVRSSSNPIVAPSNPTDAAAKKSLRDSGISPSGNGLALYRVRTGFRSTRRVAGDSTFVAPVTRQFICWLTAYL